MPESEYRAYPYRWVVLATFMVITVMSQASWITFAPITIEAAHFYGTSDLMIGLLSMSFMVIYILIVIPTAWAIDTWGLRTAVGLGAALTGVFALTRGLFAGSFPLVFASQVGLAVGQPFILGSITKVAARWFPVRERATATGLGTLAIYVGILASMGLTPPLTIRYGIRSMLLFFGIVTVVATILFFLLFRERPPTPAGHDERALMLDGLKGMLRQKDFILLMVIFFVGLGIFNGVSTWIETIIRPRGFTIAQAGTLGALMLVGGIVGAIAIPILSDLGHRRRIFIIISLIGMIPGLVGMTFATSYKLLLASGFTFGFFLLSSGPIGFQYGAEITHPAPEGTSNSLLLVMGQISGIVFVVCMDTFKSPSGVMTGSMLALIALTALSVVLATVLKESPVATSKGRPPTGEETS
ncbi:MAG TPA: MFS transporter [Thermoanaerobaculaceae bacterium]|nr:MFS transporter [Thermoanaerobaculaceae bacterium]